jgi:hypothetical protein
MKLALIHDDSEALEIHYGGQQLLRYVYVAPEAQLESPRPYFHPLRTLAGEIVSLYRPHDHVWHKGLALSLPNVADANFWGGVTYLRNGGYQQLANNGTQAHREFSHLESDGFAHRLEWITEQGEHWFDEQRRVSVAVHPDEQAWSLGFETSLTNVSGREIVIGSPTTEGRENAGYGGLFWRGPRSFSGGLVFAPGVAGSDELMGIHAPWLGFSGKHDGTGRTSTLVFVDDTENFNYPTKWFVRSRMFACICPAPFFDTEYRFAPQTNLTLRYRVVVGDGERDYPAVAKLAELGTA